MWHPHRKHPPLHQRMHLLSMKKKGLRDVSSMQHANTQPPKTIHPDFKLCFRKNEIQTPKLFALKYHDQNFLQSSAALTLTSKNIPPIRKQRKNDAYDNPQNPTNEEMR
jgi:hypothetical protein